MRPFMPPLNSAALDVFNGTKGNCTFARCAALSELRKADVAVTTACVCASAVTTAGAFTARPRHPHITANVRPEAKAPIRPLVIDCPPILEATERPQLDGRVYWMLSGR